MTPTHPPKPPKPAGRILVLEPDLDWPKKSARALNEGAPSAQVDVAPTLGKRQGLILAQSRSLRPRCRCRPRLGRNSLRSAHEHPNARAIVSPGTHSHAHANRPPGLGAITFSRNHSARRLCRSGQALLYACESNRTAKIPGHAQRLALADIIQLKCMSAPPRRAIHRAAGREGRVSISRADRCGMRPRPARKASRFNEIVNWKGADFRSIRRGEVRGRSTWTGRSC